MRHLFVPYEIALQLKEKGFNEDCFGCYYKDKTFAYHPDSDVYVDAPLYQQVIDWFREKEIRIFEVPAKFKDSWLLANSDKGFMSLDEAIKEALNFKTMNKDSYSYQAGQEAARVGNSIDNSYPFDHEEFVAGYKSINPAAKTMLDQCKTPEQRLKMLEIMQSVKNG